jgi:signal transduction histidine kinase
VALNTERPAAMVYLAAPTPTSLAAFNAQVQKTDRAVEAARTALTSSATTNSASPGEQHAISVLLTAVKTLPTLHTQITNRGIGRQAALVAYDGVVQDVYQAIIQSIRQETSATVVDQALALIEAARSEEALSEEAAVMAGDFAAQNFSAADRHEITELAGTRRTFYNAALADLDPQYRIYWARNVTPQALGALTALENKLINDSALRRMPPPISPLAWEQAIGAVAAGLTKASNSGAVAVDAYASNVAWGTARGLLIVGGLGLLAVIVSIIVAVFTGRSLVRELRDLRDSALDLANNQLPQVVDRLALGQAVDVPTAAPPLPATTVEVGQVRDAFDTVQKTAVQAAVAQARLRQGMSDVFRNLARRSQSLLHRQLTLLDAMERRARDPQELEDLFRIDHLTTRMRRHAESLIILSGHAPARGWRNPVPLVDVLRAAVAEVEDYTRIKVTAATQAALAGPAVGDVIHLIAELAENATMFSPPNTPVTIHGDTVGQGFAVEIEDRGLGLSEEQLGWINGMLENPPPFDPSSSDQLGLFVAGQLAKRHNIKISMRPSPYGGTTAIVLIPRNLVVTEEDQARDPSLTTPPGNGQQLKGRRTARGLPATASDAGTGPLEAVPSGAASPWPGAEVPPTRDPADVTGLRPGEVEVTSFGPADFGAAGPGPAGFGPGGTGGFAPGGTGGFAPGCTGGFGPGGTGGFAPGGLGESDPDGAELPRRVRQANLAPQLRESPAEPPLAPMAEILTPTPEEARSTMTAIQHGWERGRSVFDDLPGGTEPGVPNGGPAAGLDLAGDGRAPGPTESTTTTHVTGTAQGAGGPGMTPGTAAAAPTRDPETTGLQAGEAPSDTGGTSG